MKRKTASATIPSNSDPTQSNGETVLCIDQLVALAFLAVLEHHGYTK
jgi:hypothetical protein